MLRKIPIVAHPISFDDLFKGFKKFTKGKLSEKLTEHINAKYIYFANSGSSALYIILKAISENDNRKQVIIPAYTASTLIYAIEKANLKPVLCDISLDDFNMDMDKAVKLFCKDTLAVVGVHMFGIIQQGLPQLNSSFPGVYTIEDGCQAFGSKIKEKNTGGLGKISFYSFNRGKNLPVFGGGVIATNHIKLAGKIEKIAKTLPTQKAKTKLMTILKLFALSLAFNPVIYAILNPIIQLFREKPPAKDFSVEKFTNFQAGVALSLLENFHNCNQKRYNNAMVIISKLKDLKGIRFPEINPDTQPAFNRLPVIIDDISRKEKISNKLLKSGIETSFMYYKPLHHLHDLGYKKEDFPNAIYLAEHLLTIPVHTLLEESDVFNIIAIFKEN